jgi:tellurite resistance protein TehA-like permease
MSTAALASIAHQERNLWNQSWLDAVAIVLLLIASVLAVVLLPRYLAHLMRPRVATRALGDPNAGALLATVPAGILLLAAAWGGIGPAFVAPGVARWINGVLVVAGAALALWVGMLWNASTGRGARGLEGVNGSWLIPPVCTMLVAVALDPLIAPHPSYADVLLLVGYGFLGAGLVMFVVVMALLVARLILAPDLPGALAPTMWVPLAPAGIIGVAAIRLTSSAVTVGVADDTTLAVSAAIAALGFGFGVWWGLFAAFDLARMRRTRPIAFQPGWWAFVFPPAALLLCLLSIEELFRTDHLRWVSALAFIGLLGLWLYVLVRSIRGYARGATPTARSPRASAGVALAEEERRDGHEDRRDEDLDDEDEQPRPVARDAEEVADPQAEERPDDADDDGHEAPDRLHAGHEDAGDQPDDDAGEQRADDASGVHAGQPTIV